MGGGGILKFHRLPWFPEHLLKAINMQPFENRLSSFIIMSFKGNLAKYYIQLTRLNIPNWNSNGLGIQLSLILL